MFRIAPTTVVGLLGLYALTAGCSGSPLRPTDDLFVHSRLSPDAGTMLGGTRVVLTGHGFRAGVTVLFGGSPAAVTVVTHTQLTVETPANRIGPIDVVVTNPGGSKHVLAASFTYEVDPPFTISGFITEVTPNGARPVEGADVEEDGTMQSVQSDSTGAYRLAGLRRSPFEVWFMKSGYEITSRQISSTSDMHLDIQMWRTSK